ncbi:2-C-methyl-D-erythritol 2,4-cyclodiphosphate synthase [Halorhodospira abdelmalekii]|uniref:2-C-methyl-D-erythritol 2,4-cyclodiphosphate synthase n=1 Tax=Halorhodospira abdelmalekii TaxID=421629 RepID=UPI0030845D92|nr:2-C-methyl-D-erythritol 2,4-cyclodiphosphate synthase [Halorhodospira abdelmalekii]
MRIGQGFDVHQFTAKGEGFRLGGVWIPYTRGLKAHSDGDVLLHALTDAVLGAAGLGDIGYHFPDDDPRWRAADSSGLLASAVKFSAEAGWRPINADTTVIAQAPKLAGHIAAMREATAAALGLPPGAVNIKATTSEGLGFTGRGEGIAALAAVLMESSRTPHS